MRAKYALLVGENELAMGRFILRNMANVEQLTVTETELKERLKTIE
jgi:histidyl-tRNA synthetase